MILSYGICGESFSCDSDSSSSGNDDSIGSSTSTAQTPRRKEIKMKNMFTFETVEVKKKRGRPNQSKNLTSEYQASSEAVAEDFVNLREMINKQREQNEPTLDFRLQHFSNDTLCLLNCSFTKPRDFNDSELELSNCSFLHNPSKNRVEPRRCHSNSSFQNLIDHFEEEEERRKQKKLKKKEKDQLKYQSNIQTIYQCDVSKDKKKLNQSDNYENIKHLLNSEDKISLNTSCLSTSPISSEIKQKKKENFIPKSEIFRNADDSYDPSSSYCDMKNPVKSNSGKFVNNFQMNPLFNYYEIPTSTNKSLGAMAIMKIEEAYETLNSSYERCNSNSSQSSHNNSSVSSNNSQGHNNRRGSRENSTVITTQINCNLVVSHFSNPSLLLNNNTVITSNIQKPDQRIIPNYSSLSNQELSKVAEYIARDQSGCRFLQKKMQEDRHFANETLYFDLEASIVDLMVDPFGNYLIQKLLETLDDVKILKVLDTLQPKFEQVSTSPHGTRVIQKVIEVLDSEEKLQKFSKMLFPHVITLCKDSNANHIVQKYLLSISSPFNQFLYDVLFKNLDEICTDKHGCCVMQKAINAADPIQKYQIIEYILAKVRLYMTDQYANYVIQFIISICDTSINKRITETFINEIRELSVQKHSSNVIEKIFDHSNSEVHGFIVSHMVNGDVDRLVSELIVDVYGNYVLQKAVAVAKGDNYVRLMKGIGNNLDKLKCVPYGNKLLTKFLNACKDLPQSFNGTRGGNKNMNYISTNNGNGLNPMMGENLNLNNNFIPNNVNMNNSIGFYNQFNQINNINNNNVNFFNNLNNMNNSNNNLNNTYPNYFQSQYPFSYNNTNSNNSNSTSYNPYNNQFRQNNY